MRRTSFAQMTRTREIRGLKPGPSFSVGPHSPRADHAFHPPTALGHDAGADDDRDGDRDGAGARPGDCGVSRHRYRGGRSLSVHRVRRRGVPRADERIARAPPRRSQGQPGECRAVRGGSRSRRRRLRAGGRPGRGACGHGLRPRDAGSESRPGASHPSRPTWPRVLHQAVGGTARRAHRRGAVSADRGALRLDVGNRARLRHGDFGRTGHSAVARTVGRRPQPRAPCPHRRPRAVRSPRPHDSAPAPDRAGCVQLRCDAVVACSGSSSPTWSSTSDWIW